MVESFNIVRISTSSKEQFRVYSELKFLGYNAVAVRTYKKNTISNRYQSNIRAKRRIHQLIDTNFSEKFTLLTLTFRENITQLDIANEVFTNFIRRLKYYLKTNCDQNAFSLQYLCVIETQTRGAIHYHVLTNIPRDTSFSDIIKIWNSSINVQKKILIKGGSVHIDYSSGEQSDGEHVSKYLGKYLLTANVNPIFCGKKIYFSSRNLKQPVRNNYKVDITSEQLTNNKLLIQAIEQSFKSELSNKHLKQFDIYKDKYSGKDIFFLEYKK